MSNIFNVEFIRGSIYDGDDYNNVLSEDTIERIPDKEWIVSLDMDEDTIFLFKVKDIIQYPNKNIHKIFGDVIRVVDKI